MDSYFNLVEPPSLIGQFLAQPPDGFEAFLSPEGVPVFSTRFDLLTTADAAFRRRISALPFYRKWRRLLMPSTCFVGTTVSEYAIFPRTARPGALLRELKERYARDFPFFIIKDLPQGSPLLDAEGNAFAQELMRCCESAGFAMLEGQALAYVTIDFESIDDYLSRLSHARRKDIRRKLRVRSELDVQVRPCGGDYFSVPAVLQEYYELYSNVYRQSELKFDLLSEGFFRAMLQDASNGGVVFEYRHQGRLIGYNICFVSRGMLIDKYVGFRYPQARDLNLYFVSWFHNLAFAKESGLRLYVAGWTDPEIKANLGAKFTFTRHAVHVRNPLLRGVLRRFSRHFESDRAWHDAHADATPGHS